MSRPTDDSTIRQLEERHRYHAKQAQRYADALDVLKELRKKQLDADGLVRRARARAADEDASRDRPLSATTQQRHAKARGDRPIDRVARVLAHANGTALTRDDLIQRADLASTNAPPQRVLGLALAFLLKAKRVTRHDDDTFAARASLIKAVASRNGTESHT